MFKTHLEWLIGLFKAERLGEDSDQLKNRATAKIAWWLVLFLKNDYVKEVVGQQKSHCDEAVSLLRGNTKCIQPSYSHYSH